MSRPKRIPPQLGQESVWDYPRPPRLEPISKSIQIYFNGRLFADTKRAYRVLETSHPPTYYLPPDDLKMDYLKRGSGGSLCEWKGQAKYYTLSVDGKTAENVGWYYPNPTSAFAPIKNHVAFYAGPMDRCVVAGEIVSPQPGGFYGGWVTSDVVGPFKGELGTMWW